MRVLLVDDCSDELRRVRELLLVSGKSSCRVETAADLGCAFALLRRLDFDVVLIGLTHPTGIPRIRALRRGVPYLPLVGMGPEDDGADSAFWVREGADDFVAKEGVEGPMLLRTLVHAIARRRTKVAGTAHDGG